MVTSYLLDTIVDVIADHYQVPKSYVTHDYKHGKNHKIRYQAMYVAYSFLNERGHLYKTVFKKEDYYSVTLRELGAYFGGVTKCFIAKILRFIKQEILKDISNGKDYEEIITIVYKIADFGARRKELGYDEKDIKFELYFDKHGAKYYAVSTKTCAFRLSEAEFEVIADLKDRSEYDFHNNKQ